PDRASMPVSWPRFRRTDCSGRLDAGAAWSRGLAVLDRRLGVLRRISRRNELAALRASVGAPSRAAAARLAKGRARMLVRKTLGHEPSAACTAKTLAAAFCHCLILSP